MNPSLALGQLAGSEGIGRHPPSRHLHPMNRSTRHEKTQLISSTGAANPKFAVISDIHGNLPALVSVLNFLEAEQITFIICLGDIVGYGPHPAECIRLLAGWRIPCVRGNHDAYAIARRVPTHLHPDARISLHYARRQLSQGDVRFLAALPARILFCGMAFVHASFPHPHAWEYVFDRDDALAHLQAQPKAISFFGHTHRPGGFASDGNRVFTVAPEPIVDLNVGRRVCFNPGSVGQSRDNDARASLLVCDPVLKTVEFHRVAYDVERTVADILAAGLPERLAFRLQRRY